MENATKALLIAAGVLVAVILISLGIIIVRNAGATIADTSAIDEIEIKKHNTRYEVLEGVQSGRTVKQILNYAIEDNESLGDAARKPETEMITVNIRSNSDDILDAFRNNSSMYNALTTRAYGVRYVENIREVSNVVSYNKKYKIWFSYSSIGWIWEIHIDKT